MRIAVEGCCHGQLHDIYAALAKEPEPVDLLLICGDFQAVRNEQDLSCLLCPPKYRKMGDFADYFSGQADAPILTVFIGGNHEAVNHSNDLYYGGWVCKNIFYLGHAGVIRVCGLRIAGLSGIFYGKDFKRGYYEREPYSSDMLRSAYHYREFEIEKLKMIKDDIDIFLSHEWPTGIYNFGDKDALLRRKPYFRDEVQRNVLGAKPLEDLLFALKPKHWFSAHMHVCFEAQVKHPSGQVTDFLALDKCLPRREFMRIVEIESKSPHIKLEYDSEWIGILRHAEPFISRTPAFWNISREFFEGKDSIAPVSFEDSVIPHPIAFDMTTAKQQTIAFKRKFLTSPPPASQTQHNPEEIDISL